MKHPFGAAMILTFGLFAFAVEPQAGCGWFGTQLECDLGRTQVSLGTQKDSDPACVGLSTLQPVAGCDGLFADRRPATALRVELQNVGAGPCRQFGSETYCY